MLKILKMSITSYGIFVTTDKDEARKMSIPGVARSIRKTCEVLVFYGTYDVPSVWAQLIRAYGEENLSTDAEYRILESIRYSQLKTVLNKSRIIKAPSNRAERILSWESELICS